MLNPCEFCDAQCCKDYIITVTSFDVKRIMGKTRRKFGEIASLEPLRMLNYDNDTVLECYEGKLRYEYVLALKSHPCMFLENSRCKVHGFAPLVCRLYPHDSGGKMAARARCPPIPGAIYSLTGPHPDLERYRKQISRYKELVAKWNRKRGSLEKCAGFLMKESGKRRF